MNDNNIKIYSTQRTRDGFRLVEIETTILNGLYRFSILGINQKGVSDIKDKIYSSLRFQKILNLKSDNKKITVNIVPRLQDTNIDNIYDLAIAICLLNKMNKVTIDTPLIALGELTILGKILTNESIFGAIYQAIKNDIKIIICNKYDVENIINKKQNILEIIESNKIKFIVGDDLEELIKNIQNKNYYKFKNKDEFKIIECDYKFIINLNEDIIKIIFALSIKHHLLICKYYNSKNITFIRNLIFYQPIINAENLLYISNTTCERYANLSNKLVSPYINNVEINIKEDDLYHELNKSYFGFNIVENILNLDKNIINIIKHKNTSSVIAFYTPCPCGNLNLFFKDGYNKCLCLKRNIIRHLNKIEIIDDGFFDFKISNNEYDEELDQEDFININNFILKYKNTEQYNNIYNEDILYKYIKDNYNIKEINEINRMVKLSTFMEKFLYIIDPVKYIKVEDVVGLTIKLTKKDF